MKTIAQHFTGKNNPLRCLRWWSGFFFGIAIGCLVKAVSLLV